MTRLGFFLACGIALLLILAGVHHVDKDRAREAVIEAQRAELELARIGAAACREIEAVSINQGHFKIVRLSGEMVVAFLGE